MRAPSSFFARISLGLILLLVMGWSPPAVAAPPVCLSNSVAESGGGGAAIIGESCTYQVFATSDSVPPDVACILQITEAISLNMGTPVLIGPNLYQFTLIATPIPTENLTMNGNKSTPVRITLVNASGTTIAAPNATLLLDGTPPTTNGLMAVTVNGTPLISQVVKRGDILNFSQSMTAAYQSTPAPGEIAELNFSAWGMGIYAMTNANPHVLSGFTFSDGHENVTGNVAFRAEDPFGNVLNIANAKTITVDTTPPVIGSINLTVSPSGTARPGSTVTIDVTLSTTDPQGDTVTVSNSHLGLTNFPLNDLGGGLFSYSFTVASSPPATPYFGPSTFSVTVRDDAGNLATATSPIFNLDNKIAPVTSGNTIITYNGVTFNAGTAQTIRRTDVLSFTQHMTAASYQPGETAVIDFTPDFAPPLGTYNMTSANPHVLSNFTISDPMDTGPGTIYFQAWDPNGNTVGKIVAKTNVYIDTIAPVIVSSLATTTQQTTPARPGDTLNITVTIAAYDNDSVTVTNAALGLTDYPLTYSGGNVFTGSIVIPSSPTMPPFNGMASLSIKVIDNGNNVTTGTTPLFALDNRLPDMPNQAVASFSENRAVYGDDVAIASDTLIFIATATWAPGQNVRVYVDLSPIGGPAQVQLNQTGPNSFRLDWIIPEGTSEDTVARSFKLWAVDSVTNNTIERWSTPPLRIDNVSPKFLSTTFTKIIGTGTSFNAGDRFRLRTQVANLSIPEMGALGAVTADLSRINQAYSATTLLNPDPLNPGWFEGVFDVGVFDPGTGWDTNSAIPTINLVASDGQGNLAFTSVSMGQPIDNEPPVIASTSFSYIHNWYPTEDLGVVRIWDTMNFSVQVASYTSVPDRPPTVTINLSAIGGAAATPMVLRAPGTTGWFDFTHPNLATGTINRQFVSFPITVTDNNGNVAISSITVFLDNTEPKVDRVNLAISYNSGMSDPLPTVINLNKFLDFTVPYVMATPDDHATATIDLTYVGSTAAELMASNSVTYYYSMAAASPPTNIQANNYRFTAVVRDSSGNRKTVQTQNGYTVDCWPPSILAATATIVGGGSVATIGRDVYFAVRVRDNEGGIPTLDLTSIGGGPAVPMVASTTAPSGEWFGYTFRIATGSLNDVVTSWTVTIQDDVLNTVSTFTTAIRVDNVPPVTGPIVVSGMADPGGNIRLGDALTFTMTTPEGAGAAAQLNLTMVGGGSAVSMALNPTVDFSYGPFTTLLTNARYLNASFSAWVSDPNGNRARAWSAPIAIIDCQPPQFATTAGTHGIVIAQDNGDNPVPTVANTNDVITVFASLSYHLDAIATATIFNAADLTTELASVTMTYVSARNRHEGSFTIPPGVAPPWQLDLATLTYVLTASDAVNNVSNTVTGNSSFRVKNIPPVMDAYAFSLNPNVFETANGGFLVYNIGSMTAGAMDRLWVIASLTAGQAVTRAEIDLSRLGGPSAVNVPFSGTTASSTSGLNLMTYIGERDRGTDTVELAIKVYDQAGNPAIGSQSFWIDTKRPSLVGAWFDGASLTVQVSEAFQNLSTTTWILVGSSTSGTEVTLQLTKDGIGSDSWYEYGMLEPPYFHIELSNLHRRAIAQWASTPIYLRAQSTAVAPLTDWSGNWLPSYNAFRVTLTDTSWRIPAKFQNITITDIPNWPNTFTVVMQFDQEMDITTLVASAGLLLVDHQIDNYFDQPDYARGYIFQASDSFAWDPGSTTLRITLCPDGRDWVARYLQELGKGKTLKFANRRTTPLPSKSFLMDALGRPMHFYSCATGSTFPVADNRPTNFTYNVEIGTAPPKLDLVARTLTFETTDRTLLFGDDFRRLAGAPDPTLLLPTTTIPLTTFRNKIRVHAGTAAPFASFTTLAFKNLDPAKNNAWASTTFTLDLTDNDFANLIALSALRGPSGNLWLEVQPGAFVNIWNQGISQYGPGGPDVMDTVYPTTPPASFVACVVSDPPPTRNWAPGTFRFHFEYAPAYIGDVEVPLLNATPTATIASTAFFPISGTFLGWTTRLVDGKKRYIAQFTNAAAFPDGLQLVDVAASISGVRDAFNAIPDVVATLVYDLAATSTTGLPAPNRGFTTASAPFILDTASPTATAISPNDFVPILAANTEYFFVDYSEPMDPTGGNPAVTIATTGYLITCAFSRWVTSTRAAFRNTTAIDDTLPNGTWTYSITGGRDLAGNGAIASTSLVEVRTNGPKIVPTDVFLETIQSTIDATAVLRNQPYSYVVPPGLATLTFTYQTPPENTPHTARFFNAANVLVGTTLVTLTGSTGEVSLNPGLLGSPGIAGPIDFTFRIRDNAGNETGILSTIVYDAASPTLDQFGLQYPGTVGTFTDGVYYYSPTVALGNLTARARTITATDALRLAIYDTTSGATSTLAMTQSPARHYSVDFGYTPAPLSNGLYTLSVVDAAGNLHLGSPSLQLIVDTDPPSVLSCSPISPPAVQGPAPSFGATFTVIFSEPLDRAAPPTLELFAGATVVAMASPTWADPNIATTARFLNLTPIVRPTIPTGTYTYRLTGGRDLAGNPLNTTIPAPGQLYIQTAGPTPTVVTLTNQPLVFGSALRSTDPFSPLVQPPGVATFVITYTTSQAVGTHSLLLFNGSIPVATFLYDCPAGPATVEVSTDSANWLAIIPPNAGPATFTIWIRDQYGNLSDTSRGTLTYDSRPATISQIVFTTAGHGIATGGVQYYSPRFGPFTLSLTTNPTATEPLRLVASSGGTILSNGTILTPPYALSTGTTLTDGLYQLSFYDLAGNSCGATGTLMLRVDRASPTVTMINPSLQAGVLDIGPAPVGGRIFTVDFSEPMDTSEIPFGRLIHRTTPTASIPLELVGWISSTSAQFRNAAVIDTTVPQGTYTITIGGADDLAGNRLIPPGPTSFTIQIRSVGPTYLAALLTQQHLISTFTPLLDQPFSDLAPPNVATLSITYTLGGPFGPPHQVLIYDPSGTNVGTAPVAMAGVLGSATLDGSVFGSPAFLNLTTYTARIQDIHGNISATAKSLVFDNLPADVTSFILTGVSDATTTPGLYYYNDAISGAITFTVTTTATDPQRLLIASGTATTTIRLTPTATGHTLTRALTQAAGFGEGLYGLTIVDLAGNFATGVASAVGLVIDRTAPTVLSLTSLPAAPLYTMASGAATFTVTFSEPMNQRTATPTMTIATTGYSIPCRFVGWVGPAQAQFVNTQPINEMHPQGPWNTVFTGTDLARNPVAGPFPAIVIQSRGPIVTAFTARSFQSTTASDASEILLNQPFSFNVPPGEASLTIQVSQPPVEPVSIVFLQAGSPVASSPIAFSGGTMATYAWNMTSGPWPAAPTTYVVKLIDALGNASRETYSWTMDASEPLVLAAPNLTGGILGTGAYYFNPALGGGLTCYFSAAETVAPRLRVRGQVSTDTFPMTGAGVNQWSGTFYGQYSRGGVPKPTAPDGIYYVDIVDAAGNVGLPSGAFSAVATAVLDTVAPVISTYTLLVDGQPRSRFSPTAATLTIQLTTTEPIVATGVWWVEVRTDANTYVNRLPVTASGAYVIAQWNGTRENGQLVIDGLYHFHATDYTRNVASNRGSIFVISSPFRIQNATQISSTVVDLTFNHDINPATVVGTAFNVTGQTGIIASLTAPTVVRLTLTPGLIHNVTHTITVSSALRSTDGAAAVDPNNKISLLADARGPVLTGTSFQGLTGQREVIVQFDEAVTLASAQATASYLLERAGTPIALTSAILRADQTSVILSASTDLLQGVTYSVRAIAVRDRYQNLSTGNTVTFQGRDLTPPVLEVAAFSNPANEYDLIVVARANEALQGAPTLRYTQSNLSEVALVITPTGASLTWMAGIHLNQGYPGNGTLVVSGTDLAGNTGSRSEVFTIAYVSASVRTLIHSPDQRLAVDFPAGSLRKDSLVTILPQTIELTAVGSTTRAALRPRLASLRPKGGGMALAKNKVLAAQTDARTLEQQAQELSPAGGGFELGLPAGRLTGKAALRFRGAALASDSARAGIFRYDDERGWVFLSNARQEDGLHASITQGGLYAVLCDQLAPRLTLSTKVDPDQPFRTTRPEFAGRLEEAGSGLDATGLLARLDDGPPQPVTVLPDGTFRFTPVTDLTGGRHTLTLEARDRVGNLGQLAGIRFAVAVPLAIGEISAYPNPANRRAVLRISANRDDLAEGLVEVKLYDAAGHKVRTLTGVRPVRETWGTSRRFLYDIPWDLTNEEGDPVANGLYIAKVVLTDPDNPERRIRQTHKIAVLR
ncbi:MAG: hypothetical protein OZSIB_3468 [Candidatus Ozemobacter sibiricus]|uniref:Ig-like domain-containing protein n=1 Tax=Candidatus Ozemobacter sibiricus TaxID=2268124 RepID=A0A367ZQF8_9BACT|nr:MAG: hypothetical protein OZSIB_3468 [Candidatus Ozemobacter sibiricus]